MRQAHMIFDIGTGNSRVGIVSTAGEVLSVATKDSVYYYDRDFKDSIYFVPSEWIKIFQELVHNAMEKAGEVEILSVSASSQRQGIVLISEEGESLVGYQNGDNRGADYMRDIPWSRVKELTGLDPMPIYSCIKFRGTMKKQPYVADKTKYYTSISDWIGYLATGKVVWEKSQAMQTAVYDVAAGTWSEELCGLLEIDPGKLPPLAPAGTVLGKLTPEFAQKFHLPKSAVYVVGAADTQTALIGSAAEENEVTIVSGTTTPVVKIKDRFMQVPVWMGPHAVDGQYMLEVNAASTGINLQRFKNMFLQQYTYEDLIGRCLEKPIPGCMAMFAMGPHLAEAPVQYGGFLLDNPIGHDMEAVDFFHAMSLDIAMSITLCIERINQIDPYGENYVVGCGGGLRSQIITQAIADLSGFEIRLFQGYDQATMMGCMRLCNKGLQISAGERKLVSSVQPDENPRLQEYFEKWKRMRSCYRLMNS